MLVQSFCRKMVITALLALAVAALAANVGAIAQNPGEKSPAQTPQKSSLFTDAEELIRQGKFAEAESLIEQKLQQNPASAEGYALLGVVQTEEKKYPEATQAFEHSLKLNPKSTKARNSLGNLYVLQGNLDLAEKEFRESVRLNPEDHDGNYNLGLVLLAKKKPTEAIVYLQKVRPPGIESQMNLTTGVPGGGPHGGRIADGHGAIREEQR